MQKYKAFKMNKGYWSMYQVVPKYNILETIEDSVTKTVWHKLRTNEEATKLILNLNSSESVYQHTEITGKSFFWVTDQILTLLTIQGIEQGIE